MMRQAGRILPEYRAIRASLSGFKELVSTPDLAAEVTVQPVDILDVDAAIIFSDILVIPEAMGLHYELIEKKGPFFPEVIRGKEDVSRLDSGQIAAERLGYVYNAIEQTKKALQGRVPLIGFAGAPFTLLAYMVEGSGSKTFSQAKRMLYKEPALAHQLLEKITGSVIEYLKLKVRAGVDVVQVFDSWAGVLDRDIYNEFCMPYLQRIVQSLQGTPVIMFAKGAWFCLKELGELPGAAIGLDWQTSPQLARKILGPDRVLQGNLDPSILLSAPDVIEEKTNAMLHSFGTNHIANLGHGVYPDTPVEHVKAFINTIKGFKYS